MEYSMSGEMMKKLLGDKGEYCYSCEDKNNLTECKACKLTKCNDCMSNEDICSDCMYELETTGGFDTYTSYEFEAEMIDKYLN